MRRIYKCMENFSKNYFEKNYFLVERFNFENFSKSLSK